MRGSGQAGARCRGREQAEPASCEADAADHERVVGEGEERVQGAQRGEVVVDDAGEEVRGGV